MVLIDELILYISWYAAELYNTPEKANIHGITERVSEIIKSGQPKMMTESYRRFAKVLEERLIEAMTSLLSKGPVWAAALYLRTLLLATSIRGDRGEVVEGER